METVFVNVNKMKYIITESQYNKLTEEDDEENFEVFLKKRFPKIDNLKKETANKSFAGLTNRYFDPEKEELYFRVALRTAPKWEPGVGMPSNDEFIRLYVSPKVYNYVKKYGMNFEYDLMDWFNKTYGEEVNSVLKKTFL